VKRVITVPTGNRRNSIMNKVLRGLRKTAVYLWFAVVIEYIFTRVIVFVSYQQGVGDELMGWYKDDWLFEHFSWVIIGIILYNIVDFSARIIVSKEYKASNFIFLALNVGIVLFGIFS
jgi:hypothetical protein